MFGCFFLPCYSVLLNVELLKLLISLSVFRLSWAHRFCTLNDSLLFFFFSSNAYYVMRVWDCYHKESVRAYRTPKGNETELCWHLSTRKKSDDDVIRRHWKYFGVIRSDWPCLYHLYVKKLAPTCSLTVPLREITPKNSRLFSPSCALLSTRSRLAAPRRHSSSGI